LHRKHGDLLLKELKVIAITHKTAGLESIGKLHIEDSQRPERLRHAASTMGFKEITFLSTCNRVEYILHHDAYLCKGQTAAFLQKLYPEMDEPMLQHLVDAAELFEDQLAFEHLLRVSASLESMVIGEREIITQMRKAYEESRDEKLSGDLLRLVFRKVIEGAKRVYTETEIARKPVSVVSLAWHKFKAFNLHDDARILLVGAGQIISSFSKFLEKEHFTNITVFNRSFDKAEALAARLKGNALPLEELSHFQGGFDAIVSCTGAANTIISAELYAQLNGADTKNKLVIDLALPNDVDPGICNNHRVEFFSMVELKQTAEANIAERSKALHAASQIIAETCKEFKDIYQQRQIELAMQSIPEKIKEIKETALGVVFAKELESLDGDSKELLERIMEYLEKKYISVPMKMAKEVLMDKKFKN
jgi:glutamyl-tRNA reductase